MNAMSPLWYREWVICFLGTFLAFGLTLPTRRKSPAGPDQLLEEETLEKAEVFLQKYGYIKQGVHAKSHDALLKEAVKEFQWVTHIPMSGVLDDSTIHQMSLPRCGVKDTKTHSAWAKRVNAIFLGKGFGSRRRKRFSPQGEKWYKRHLSYRIVNWPRFLSPSHVRLAFKTAFELWSNVSSLVFWEKTEGPADIRLAFFQGNHNDGTNNAFDGPGGALAHAFFPRRGEAHFDNDERWSLNRSKGRNLFIVAAHEIGHTLGLEHSSVRNALMSPYYKKLGRDFVLNLDDILAIQNLYGNPPNGAAFQLPGNFFISFQDHTEHDSDVPSTAEPSGPSSSYCYSFFDAITMDLQHNVYIFKGSHYWNVSKEGYSKGPYLLQKSWPELPSTIEAAGVSEADGKFYFFKGSRCWRYQDRVLEMGFPQKTSTMGLPRHPDAAFYFPPLGHMVVFKGPKYYILNEELLQVEPYYPRSLQDWKGLPLHVNGVITREDGFMYFLKEDSYWKFDKSRLKVVSKGLWANDLHWTGCQDKNITNAVDGKS
ncbi:matrix metalloproteinase-28 [Protopterus annectens]|uniref:matrix metalloproteinase-28 n=1 Tax=Protopterus annectens TaxID=7888 RepID=UPI001CFC21BC|nr:matrix metalloproteinase-28 [Protopterus annectens]